MTAKENPKPPQPAKTDSKCILSPDAISIVVEGLKQFIISIQNEAAIKDSGIFETRDLLIKEVQEKFASLEYIRQVCIEEHHLVSHSFNVASLSLVIAIKIGLRQDDLKNLTLAALVHDVGKIKLPYKIIAKHLKLTPKELELYKLHVPLGFKIARDELKFDPLICRIILEHHERYDGSGYPKAISGHDQHLFSQIIAVVDNFDMMLNNSINPTPFSVNEVAKDMLGNSHKFSPQVLHSLVHMIRYSK